MKFFHLSDLHLGLKLQNRDLGEDQRHILDQICRHARDQQPDAVVIAGDIYDRAMPAADAVTLFDDFITALSQAAPEAELMLISGNHDSGPRLDLYRGILERHHIHAIGLPPQEPEDHIECVTLSDQWGPVNFYLLPFVKPSMLRKVVGTREDGSSLDYDQALRLLLSRETIPLEERNVLVSHQFYLPQGTRAQDVERSDSEVCTVGNIDAVGADMLDPFDYAALGHIHKPMTLGEPRFRYCGTPLACSVSEAGQEKGLVMVELGPKGTLNLSLLPLEPLRQVRVLRGTLEEVLQQPSPDYVSVLLTDRVDLDVLDMQDRLRAAFPCLLEIHRETLRAPSYAPIPSENRVLDPFDLCSSFLPELTEEEQALLRQVINEVKEVQS